MRRLPNPRRGPKATLDGFQDARVVANDRQFRMYQEWDDRSGWSGWWAA